MTDGGFTFPGTLPAQVKEACARGLNTHEAASEVSQLRGEFVTEAMVVAALLDAEPPPLPPTLPTAPRRLSKEIIAEVADRWGVSPKQIVSPSRLRMFVLPRCEAIRAVAKERPDLSYPQLGRIFHRDHTSIMHHLGRKDGRKAACRCDAKGGLEGATCEDATP